MTVYVVQENPMFDYSNAERYGDLVYLASREYRGLPQDASVLAAMRKKLDGFDHTTDYLLLTGSPIMMGFAMSVVYDGTRPLNVLRWDNRNYGYDVVRLNENRTTITRR